MASQDPFIQYVVAQAQAEFERDTKARADARIMEMLAARVRDSWKMGPNEESSQTTTPPPPPSYRHTIP